MLARRVTISGGGPAGASAALAAIAAGCAVDVIERSIVPRHKVCGEFLSPEIMPLLDGLRLLEQFANAQPARVSRMTIRIGRRERTSRLPEPAFGLSRYRFDDVLLAAARSRGASVLREQSRADVVATGRQSNRPRGRRLFGFKAHFAGPSDDAVALYFFGGCYVGVSPIEGGRTNVCGIAAEDVLRGCSFEPEGLMGKCDALSARLSPLKRDMGWLFTGPLAFGNRLSHTAGGDVYMAGDALSFVDPFTGTGLVSAIATGTLAGGYAARGEPVARYTAHCRRVLGRPFGVASALRWIVSTPWAERLLECVPGEWMYRATRPRVA